jgi:hypothetical protein
MLLNQRLSQCGFSLPATINAKEAISQFIKDYQSGKLEELLNREIGDGDFQLKFLKKRRIKSF